MLLPVLIYISSQIDIVHVTFISLRDYEYTGEDKALAAALAERMPTVEQSMLTPPDLPPDYVLDPMSEPSDPHHGQEDTGFGPGLCSSWTNVSGGSCGGGGSGDGSGGGRRSRNIPVGRNFQHVMADAMKQQIYRAMEALAIAEPIVKKYENDPKFRVGYSLGLLNRWLTQLRRYHYRVVMHRHPWNFKFTDFLFHYSHLLRINIDITYTVEYMSFLHNSNMEKRKIIKQWETGAGESNF